MLILNEFKFVLGTFSVHQCKKNIKEWDRIRADRERKLPLQEKAESDDYVRYLRFQGREYRKSFDNKYIHGIMYISQEQYDAQQETGTYFESGDIIYVKSGCQIIMHSFMFRAYQNKFIKDKQKEQLKVSVDKSKNNKVEKYYEKYICDSAIRIPLGSATIWKKANPQYFFSIRQQRFLLNSEEELENQSYTFWCSEETANALKDLNFTITEVPIWSITGQHSNNFYEIQVGYDSEFGYFVNFIRQPTKKRGRPKKNKSEVKDEI